MATHLEIKIELRIGCQPYHSIGEYPMEEKTKIIENIC